MIYDDPRTTMLETEVEIDSIKLASADAISTYTFNFEPDKYDEFTLWMNIKAIQGSSNGSMRLQFNGDTGSSYYSARHLGGISASANYSGHGGDSEKQTSMIIASMVWTSDCYVNTTGTIAPTWHQTVGLEVPDVLYAGYGLVYVNKTNHTSFHYGGTWIGDNNALSSITLLMTSGMTFYGEFGLIGSLALDEPPSYYYVE